MDKPPVAIIGAGAVGGVLARRLKACGYRIEAVVSRTEAHARALADAVEAPAASASVADLPETARLVFCCVPDDAVGAVARVLGPVRRDWEGTVVAHTSGALPAAALYNLGEQGASLLSFHPLQTFTAASPAAVFEGIYVALEGDAGAVAVGRRVAGDLGARSVVLAAEAKTRYHLAASMASNFFVTLMALVGEVLGSIDLDRREGAALMRPLVEGTWHNLAGHLPEDILTGPIVRGDARTVAAHLDALKEHLPHLIPVYAALGVEAVRVAVRSSRLAPDAATALLDLLHAALESHQEP